MYSKYLLRTQFLSGDYILTERQATDHFDYRAALDWYASETDGLSLSREGISYVMLVGERDGFGFPIRSIKQVL